MTKRTPQKSDAPPLRNQLIGAGAAIFLLFLFANQEPGEKLDSGPDNLGSSPPEARATGPSRAVVQTMALQKLESMMRDPASMQTRSLRVPSGAGYLCGEVNGANAFGGKTGFKRFLVGAASGMPSVIEDDGQMASAEFNDAWERLC